MKTTMQVFIMTLASISLLTTHVPAEAADVRILDARSDGQLLLNEEASAPDTGALGWQSIYSAYSCVCHHSYAEASRWLMNALRQGGGSQVLKARTDLVYLSNGLNSIAAKRHEAAVLESSCDAQILQALMQNIVDSADVAIDTLKMVALNNPKYPSLQYLKIKIRSMEFEKLDKPWLAPLDVAQLGGRLNHLSKWKMTKFPLKVYIPTDAAASKIAGYRVGDGQLLHAAFETWERQSGGKMRFVYEPVKSRADITCVWASDQKELQLSDAIGLCSRWSDANNNLLSAQIKILTFTNSEFRYVPSGFDMQFRNKSIEEVCIHEIGHSLGLNHSASENDVMCPRAHWQPITNPTTRDVAALKSLYQTNLFEYISDALDAIGSGQYKVAAASLDKAILANPKDKQGRNIICTCLSNAATEAMHKDDYSAAIQLLQKASAFASGGDYAPTRERVLKSLHYAYLQSGRTKEAVALEKQNTELQPDGQEGASFLDHYGLKRDSIPYYETALTKSPDDLAIRAKFCFLLVMLARDETSKNNFDEAIALSTRAKSLLRKGMPFETINKVMNALRDTYLAEEHYEEADQTMSEVNALRTSFADEKKATAEDHIARFIVTAKKKHPEEWSSPVAEKLQFEKVRLAYTQYVEDLRSCAASMNVKDEQSWGVMFIVRHKQYDRTNTDAPLVKLFNLRNRLVALADEGAVIELETLLSFKDESQKSDSIQQQ
jgi:tetratricopeptide (TPR) repeat protein